MNRLFKRTDTIKYFNLDKIWDFVIDSEDKGLEEKWYEHFPETYEPMPVPSCWNNTLGYFRYMGTAWYRTYFETECDTVFVKFEAVANECDVYIDKKFIGHHVGGFTEFSFDALSIGKGKHEIVVRVNNIINLTDTIPHIQTDWYNYGGINRSVEICEADNVHIKNVNVNYTLNPEDKTAVIRVDTSLWSKDRVSDKLKIAFDGKTLCEVPYTAEGGCVFSSDDITLKDIEIWDTDNPVLYSITVSFGGIDLTDRIGFRKIECRGKDIFLNGKKITLTGVCRHEHHPDWGFSMPFELIKKDIDIIRELNCNTVRGSHYPNSKKTLDYCDETGMLFWEEIPMWGNREEWAESFKNETFIEKALNMHREMVSRDINHPSIIFWGLHNEVDTTLPQTRELTKRLVNEVRSLDNSRLITFASNKINPGEDCDICLDLVDVASFNYYTAWYSSSREESFSEFVKRTRDYVNSQAGEIPIIMSEFGGGGIKGVTALEAQRWTETYQEALLEEAIKSYLGSGEICGTYIWQYCDINSQFELEMSRPRGFNNKGIVDEYRRPKQAFNTVKRLYAAYNPVSKNKTKITLF